MPLADLSADVIKIEPPGGGDQTRGAMGFKMTAPYQAMASADGYFVMGANNQKLWLKLCALIHRPDLAENARFTTILLRLGDWRQPGDCHGLRFPHRHACLALWRAHCPHPGQLPVGRQSGALVRRVRNAPCQAQAGMGQT